MWFRRDLRLGDSPALREAGAGGAAGGGRRPAGVGFRRARRLGDSPALREAVASGADGVVPLFVIDPALWGPAGAARRAYLCDSLGRLSEQVGGLQLRHGDPVEQVVAVARAAGAQTVHI